MPYSWQVSELRSEPRQSGCGARVGWWLLCCVVLSSLAALFIGRDNFPARVTIWNPVKVKAELRKSWSQLTFWSSCSPPLPSPSKMLFTEHLLCAEHRWLLGDSSTSLAPLHILCNWRPFNVFEKMSVVRRVVRTLRKSCYRSRVTWSQWVGLFFALFFFTLPSLPSFHLTGPDSSGFR